MNASSAKFWKAPVKVRDSGAVRTNALYLAIGLNLEGMKEVLGLWMAQTEGAKFWLQVVTELRNRGVSDIFIACVDGLKGFPDAIEAVFPKTTVQLCLVHMVRHSLNFVGWKQRNEVAADLRLILSPASTCLATPPSTWPWPKALTPAQYLASSIPGFRCKTCSTTCTSYSTVLVLA